jgi:hypothetical protein
MTQAVELVAATRLDTQDPTQHRWQSVVVVPYERAVWAGRVHVDWYAALMEAEERLSRGDLHAAHTPTTAPA